MTINWNSLLTEYNESYTTEYDLKSLLTFLYKDNKSMHKMETLLGVSRCAIRNKMVSLDIPIQKKGGDYLARAKVSKFLSIPDTTMSKMTAKQIASEIGVNKSYIYSLTYKFKKPFNLLKLHERRIRHEQCSDTG